MISGQQPGLFTGPNYTILKAITVIKLAGALTEAGVPAVPIFWIAAEDHDYQEIEWATLLDRDSGVEQVRVDLSNTESRPSGWLEFHDDVSQAWRHWRTSIVSPLSNNGTTKAESGLATTV